MSARRPSPARVVSGALVAAGVVLAALSGVAEIVRWALLTAGFVLILIWYPQRRAAARRA